MLGQYSSSLAVLEGVVPGALGAAGKENAVAEDSRALAAAAMALEDSCRQLEGLQAQRRAGSASGAGVNGSEPLAPRDGACMLLHCAAHPRGLLWCSAVPWLLLLLVTSALDVWAHQGCWLPAWQAE